ncbi:RHS repeat-associated core domain-containing protein [Pseudomonas sp. TH06]|uniref:RHS repeat domain-containing protein n=1 Tax=Pseudomonas sp. TH06 TaxID=2796372 RepID=UPI00191173C5|nr:RHS repeat-associated core domain-containing protein [Pseudomonas sp. TH06]MBK5526046.1 RHS repeat-associated core domain-containing protein [Pseudomonas sp. TH06]
MESNSSSAVHSNAFNFGEFVSGGVDPRTGMYTCSFSLGNLHSSDLNGPEFALALGFNPLNQADSGFGIGWSLTMTNYDLRSKVMTLSNGERYKAVETSTGLKFKEMKLQTAKVLVTGAGQYEVRYKDGRRELLKVLAGTQVAVATKIIAANGVSIALKHELFNQFPRLAEVHDAKRCLLKITRNAGQVTLTRYPDTSSSSDYKLILKNARVTAIELPVGRGWELEYEVIDEASYLYRVVNPLRGVEFIRYKRQGHRFENGVERTLPFVIAHDIYPGRGQPRLCKAYTYSDHNFLGQGVLPAKDNDLDPLYLAPGHYVYTSDEQLVVSGKVHTRIKRTYNKFHLLVAEVTTCGDAQIATATEYYCSVKKPFNEQLAQFRMPKVHTVTHLDRRTRQTRVETTATEFDGEGNLLKHVEPSGVTTSTEFYPANGGDNCPEDPLGFSRFPKKRTVTAAASDGASTVTYYDYALHPGLEGVELACVVPVEERFFEVVEGLEVLRSKTERSYLDTPKDPLRHGAMKKQSIILNDKKTSTEFSYELEDDRLRIKSSTRGFDGTLQASEKVLSTLTGLPLSEVGVDGEHIEHEYDAIGRAVCKTVAFGTPYAASTKWVYMAASRQQPATMVTTDPAGGEQRMNYDGLGRVITVQEKDCDHPDKGGLIQIRTLYSAQHDSVGRKVKVTLTDWRDGKPYGVSTRYEFDSWGQVSKTLHADGRIEHSEADPVLRQQTNWLQGMGKTLTLVNEFGKPLSVESFNLKNKSLGKTVYTYDGFGRTTSKTDPVGNITRFEYDVFDRIIRSVLPDSSEVVTDYAKHTDEELPTDIKVGEKVLGQQTYDGLNRLTQSTVGGRKSEAGYEAGFTQPQWYKSADGKKTEFTYLRDLGGLLTERKAGELVTTLTYDPVSGNPLTCTESGRARSFTYYPSGRLKSETTTFGAITKATSSTYSLQGRPITQVDVLGAESRSEYDKHGRLLSTTQGSLKTEFHYDIQTGMLAWTKTEETSIKRQMITRFAYDDIGRETRRTFEIQGQPDQTLESTYTLAGKLAQKVSRRGTQILRDEQFTYDVRGRLIQYDCAGTQKPRDPYGKEIVQQTFTFDVLDNILTVQTKFPLGVNLTTFSYDNPDPAQLSAVKHSHADYPPAVTLEYDANGRMIKDDLARTLAYDSFGRLEQLSGAGGSVIRGYHYDGFDDLVELSQPDKITTQRYYYAGRVANEVSGENSSSVVRHGGALVGQQQLGLNAGAQLFGTDQQQSVLATLGKEQLTDCAYSPYGHRPAEGGLFSLAGFNGEQLDPVTGLYLLGNGYRAYSPTLMRFLAPDSMSPFGAGGLNAYSYCLGDPVNRVDPTGHMSLETILGIGLGVLGIIISGLTAGVATPWVMTAFWLGVTSGLAGIASSWFDEYAPDDPAGEILGWISFGLGLASLGAGLAAGAKAAVNAGRKMASAFGKGLSPAGEDTAKAAKHYYKPGKGAKAAAKKAKTPVETASDKPWQLQRAKKDNFVSEINETRAKGFYELVESNKSASQAAAESEMLYEEFGSVGAGRKVTHVFFARTKGRGERIYLLEDSKQRVCKVLQAGGHMSDGQTNTMMKTAKSIDTTRWPAA